MYSIVMFFVNNFVFSSMLLNSLLLKIRIFDKIAMTILVMYVSKIKVDEYFT